LKAFVAYSYTVQVSDTTKAEKSDMPTK